MWSDTHCAMEPLSCVSSCASGSSGKHRDQASATPHTGHSTNRRRIVGILAVATGALCVSPDSLLLRIARTYSPDPTSDGVLWTIVAVKNLYLAILDMGATLFLEGSPRLVWSKIKRAPLGVVVTTLTQMMIVVGYPLSLATTNPARALLFISVNPLWAALLGRAILKDRLRTATIVTVILALGCIVLVFVATLVNGESAGPRRGDFVALATGIGLGLHLTAVRYFLRKDDGFIASISCVSGPLMGSAIFFPIAAVTSPISEYAAAFWPIILADAFGIAIVTMLAFSVAPRYIAGAEIGLVLLLENVFGPLWVFVHPSFDEAPTVWTLVGGSLLLLTLAGHEIVLLYLDRRQSRNGVAADDGSPAALPKIAVSSTDTC